MAYPSSPAVVDDLNRANGAPGSNYVAVTGFSSSLAISSNRLVANADDSMLLYRGVGPFTDGYVGYVRAAMSGSGTLTRLVLRGSADGRAGYVFETGTTYARIFRLDTGATVGSSQTLRATWVAGDIMMFVAIGTTLECWRSRSGTPTLLFSVTDSTFTGPGLPGVGGASSSSNQNDDIMIGSLDAAPPTALAQWCGIPSTDAVEAVLTLSGGDRGHLVVSTRSDLSTPIEGDDEDVSSEGVLRVAADGLAADTAYFYGVEVDGDLLASGRGEFRTAPAAAASFSFGFASCWHTDADETPVWDRVGTSGAKFFLEIGDLGYPDDANPALPVATFRDNYADFTTRTSVARLLAKLPLGYVWDDHDSGGDDSWSGSTPAMTNAQQAYRERVPYGPAVLPSASGIYRTWTWGRCRFVALDCRSHRDDPADTDDASKTLLGATQIAWLEDVLEAATEPAIFVISSVPWNDNPRTSDDGWGRYTTEQRALVASWGALGVLDRMIMLSGDAHMLGADDGTNSPGGIVALQAAPIAVSGSIKGGTFSAGTHAGAEQYGLVTVTDDGETVTVRFEGFDDDGDVAITLTVVFAPPPPGPTIWWGDIRCIARDSTGAPLTLGMG